MDFTKMQGAANDFVIVDGRNIKRDWSKIAIAVCDRHLGIGADSLIILQSSDKADFRMRIFDSDGYEAETCGNGIRCLARYALEKGIISPVAGKLTIETIATINHVTFERKGDRVVKFRASMGKPKLAAAQIPANVKNENPNVLISHRVIVYGIDLTLHLVSMGNPHAVYFIAESVGDFPLSHIGPRVENLPVFPNRTNFEVARVIDRNNIEARVWERGVGETLACGSGACAIAVASKILGCAESNVNIKLSGGVLSVEWNGQSEVILGGPAEVVFEGKWPE